MTDPLLAALPARDGTAVVTATRTWSWEELRAAAEAEAERLTRAGVSAGDRVVIEAPLTAETLARLLGARLTGALVCPTEPRAMADRVAAVRPRATLAADGALTLGDAVPTDISGAWGVATSGTTGPPRLAVLSAAGVDFVARAVAPLLALGPDTRVLTPLPLHHTYGLSQLWLAVHTGATLVLPASPLPGDLAAAARPGDVLAAVPATVRALLTAAPGPAPRMVTLAGQATPLASRAAFAAAWPTTAFVCFYGLTEATTRVTWLPPTAFLDDVTGRPLPGVDVRLDADGELLVRGPNVFAGYLDDPTATAARLRDGWLATGDLFARHGADLRFLGRRDGVFKRFGEKVVPERVEAALAEHPDVERALVLPRPGPDGELVPVAWIVARGAPPAPGVLARWLRARLPAAAIPAEVRVVPTLTTTASGKVVRRPPPETP